MGRPPRISRALIAEVSAEIGLEGLTLRAVAERLDVSVAALYHHVQGKDDLIKLAAEYSADRIPLPIDTGQHWAVWLLEWAQFNWGAFVSEPALLSRYMEGAIPAEAIAGNVERAISGLTRQGFGPAEAQDAYVLVTACAVGTAVGAIRDGVRDPEAQGGLIGRITTALIGIAYERGEEPKQIQTIVTRAVAARS